MSELPPTGSVEWKLLAARNEADRLRQYAEEVHQKHMKALLRIEELEVIAGDIEAVADDMDQIYTLLCLVAPEAQHVHRGDLAGAIARLRRIAAGIREQNTNEN